MFKQLVKKHTRSAGRVRVIHYERFVPGMRKKLFRIGIFIVAVAAIATVVIIVIK